MTNMTAQSFPNDHPASTQPTNEKPFSPGSWDAVLPPSLKTNPQAHPKHYNTGKYEVIDVIEDWNLGFNLGNVVKYVSRADHKGTPTSDLYKALFYLNREIANRERNA